MWEPWLQSLDQEDPLEKEMATHSSVLAWRIPWTEEPGRLQTMGLQRVTCLSNLNIHISGEGTGETSEKPTALGVGLPVKTKNLQKECS